jgi:lambda family phage tail tape measure protein
MASNNIARLGVVLGIDTAEFTAAIDRAKAVTRQMAAEMKRDMNAAAGEIVRLTHATSDYGKTLTQVQLVEREMTSGRYKSIDLTGTMKDRLLAAAAAYDATALAATKAAEAEAAADAKKRSIQVATDQGSRELQAMKYAMEDYGKVVSKTTQMERAFATGHLQAASPEVKQQLLTQAAAMDKLAGSTKVAATAQAGLTNTQKLNINYQLTDFFTQVASGQSVMIAAIQQGGQLKDTFGGVGGALRALGMFFTPAMLGFGSLAVVIGSVAYAAYSGNQEFKALKDSIALTGNYANVSAGDFYLMANAMSKTSRATVGDAKDVMSAMISSGQFTKQSMDSAGKAVIKFSELSGLSAKEAAEKLIPSLDGTAQSALRLNNQYNFLSLAQYKQIAALSAANKYQEAIVLTTDLLTQGWQGNQRQLGYLGQAYETAGKFASEFWDKATGIGRPQTPEEAIKKANEALKNLPNKSFYKISEAIGLDTTEAQKYKAGQFQEEIDNAQETIRLVNRSKSYSEAAKDLVAQYEAEKSQRQQNAADIAKSEIALRFDRMRIGASNEQQLNIDFMQKKAEMVAANTAKNVQQENRFELDNAKLLNNQLLDLATQQQEKLRQLKLQQYINVWQKKEAAKDALQAEQNELDLSNKALRTYTDEAQLKDKMSEKEIARAQELFMIENSGRSIRTEDLALEKEKFEIRNRGADKLEQINKDRDKYLDVDAINAAKDRAKAITAIEIQAAEDRNARLKELRAGTFGQGISRAADDYLTNMATAMEQGKQAFDSVISSMGTALDNFVKTGKLSFKDLAGSIIRDLIAIQLKASATGLFSMLVKTMFSVATGGTSTVADAAIGAMGAPKAAGGPVSAGVTHLVGENGPELFTPSGSGTIIPNHALGGAGGTTNVTNNYINAIDTKSFEQRLLGSANAIWAANTYANKSLAVGRGRS